jgi:lipopolysaccharide biosynthesis protein
MFLMVFDHFDDDGTAIDVVWEPLTIDDFASYIVWVSNRPVSNLASAYAAFGTDPDACGCFSFNKQWIDE